MRILLTNGQAIVTDGVVLEVATAGPYRLHLSD